MLFILPSVQMLRSESPFSRGMSIGFPGCPSAPRARTAGPLIAQWFFLGVESELLLSVPPLQTMAS